MTIWQTSTAGFKELASGIAPATLLIFMVAQDG